MNLTTRKASNGARKLSYSSSQLETPTLTSQRYFSSPISNQHNNISDFIPSRQGFRITNLNINSLTKHIDELRIPLFDYSIDIISIHETKLDDTIKSCEVHIPGYMNLFVVIEADKVEELLYKTPLLIL